MLICNQCNQSSGLATRAYHEMSSAAKFKNNINLVITMAGQQRTRATGVRVFEDERNLIFEAYRMYDNNYNRIVTFLRRNTERLNNRAADLYRGSTEARLRRRVRDIVRTRVEK